MSEDNGEVQRSLGRLEGKLDQALSRFASHDTQMAALDKRVGSVEKKVWWFSGAAGVIAWAATNLLGRP